MAQQFNGTSAQCGNGNTRLHRRKWGEEVPRVITENSNGLRERKRRLSLGQLLVALEVEVRVVTKGHLRRGSLGNY